MRAVCAVLDCERLVHGRGYCDTHYQRLRLHGDPLYGHNGPPLTPLDRFDAKYVVDEITGCWIWTARLNACGYGCFQASTRSNVLAHRWRWELANGPVPGGLELDHLCRTRHCVNPAHLEAVTHRENTMRGLGACAIHARKTHCKRGHEFSPENTYTPPGTTWRICRTCTRERQAAA